jgi:hypothetical protein
MKTRVTFEGICDRKVITKTITISHPDFKEISRNGLKPLSIKSQVIDYLDMIDKSDLMAEHGFSLILDYYIPKQSNDNEIEEFIMFLNKHMPVTRQLRAIMYEAKDLLFGKNKSIETKVEELLILLNISNKTAFGTLNVVEKMFTEYGVHTEKTGLGIES